jgi:RNA-directed DNA polymerase
MLSPDNVSTKLERIATLAKQMRDVPLTSLAHHIDVDWLREAHRRVRKDGAVGVDGRTADDYARDLEGNLCSLLDRAKNGDRYRAPPVRRVHIPKGDGISQRPIGIPTFEDKILQKAVAMVLEAVYEQEFLPCSYGFRPGRSAHDAVQDVWTGVMSMGGGWVLEADIESFFDSVDRALLQDVLRRRVRDGVLLRLIGKWLNAGVMEGGQLAYGDRGTPQGGVISPLLANVFLHEVLDQWFVHDVQPRMRGRSFLARYADDFVMVFANEHDAQRVLDVLPKRFERYGLRLHPGKTRLVRFRPPSSSDGEPGTFSLLGFTHFWGTSRGGVPIVKRKTQRERFTRGLRRIAEWCRHNRHAPLEVQQRALAAKLRGHYAYFGITGNNDALASFAFYAARAWRKWLSRRSRLFVSETRLTEMLRRFPLPKPRIVHSYVT